MAGKVVHTQLRGHALLRDPLLNKGSAFTPEERQSTRPDRPAAAEPQHPRPAGGALLRAAGGHRRSAGTLPRAGRPAGPQRASVLPHPARSPEELMPVVYTPTVGLACQHFSEVFQRGRGVWISPADRGRIREVLETAAAGRNIRLAVVTDNESILGIGDQGAGGMAISIGKLALYTAGAGIDPATDPAGESRRRHRQPGAAAERPLPRLAQRAAARNRVRSAGGGVRRGVRRALSRCAACSGKTSARTTRWPSSTATGTGCCRSTTTSRAPARWRWPGMLSALRVKGERLAQQRIVIHGAGAAGLGIARQIKAALRAEGVGEEDLHHCVALLDSRGLLVDDKALGRRLQGGAGLAGTQGAGVRARRRPLAGSRGRAIPAYGTDRHVGQAGAFHEALVRTMARRERAHHPAHVQPDGEQRGGAQDLLAWTDGAALVATGSPFDPVAVAGRSVHVGQGNNVFVFPAIGLGSLLAGAREVSDGMISAAAQALALRSPMPSSRSDCSTRTCRGCATSPPWAPLPCAPGVRRGLAGPMIGRADGGRYPGGRRPTSICAAARDAMWWPDYPEFV
jgi:malate dehydrogenase (oxaloacetate-decarboxylating)